MKLPVIPPFDTNASQEALGRQNTLTKPVGSLGRLEQIAAKLAGMQSRALPRIDKKVVVVAAADHGVAEEGVSAYPQSVTAQMVANFLDGGAAISVLADSLGAELIIVDAGVASDLPNNSRLQRHGLARGSANFARGPAMSRVQAEEIFSRGVVTGESIAATGNTAVVPGEMGIGNTTAAATVTSSIVGVDPEIVTGRGTGIDDAALKGKIAAVNQALQVNAPNGSDPIDVLAKVGGYEIGFLAGLMIGAASKRALIVLDGYISTSAALIANGVDDVVARYLIAGHRSVEPGHVLALEHLSLEPILDLEMRLGEGTGGVLALGVIESALALHAGMATFEEASVSSRSVDVVGENE